ncbi:hypothetical protein CLU96_3025 [Chryseobacterium sp. 52]|uniref:hypothetical protein n=1 Tax=Chryseobacterium sp. 52 TaxID=2035213 RepID=UPI000C69ED4E|nr:hypothetical protein [Chryseobacterium sp. 52]PIF46007.1 hypothetical protein CLU96_3025 [Chryseobacterium sp. 52]
MMNIAYKITSCLSIVLAAFLMFDLIKELSDGMSVLEIDFLPLLFSLLVIGNAILAFMLLIGRIKPQKHFLILQTLIIIPTGLLLYYIAFNSTTSCS